MHNVQGRAAEASLANQVLPKKTDYRSTLRTEVSVGGVTPLTSFGCWEEHKHCKHRHGNEL